MLKVISVSTSPKIESHIEKNKTKMIKRSNKKKFVITLNRLQIMIKDRYTNSKKKKASIKLSEKAMPNQLNKNNKILKYKIFIKLSERYKYIAKFILNLNTKLIKIKLILI